MYVLRVKGFIFEFASYTAYRLSRKDDEVSQSNAYFCEMLNGAIGKMIAVQADMVIKHGVLRAVYPDHIVLDVCHVPFYIRMDKIVWIS